MKKNSRLPFWIALFCAFFLLINISSNASDFGTTGLIDIPSARMMEDGEFKVSMSNQQLADIYALNYQLTPWLESTFRYTIFNPDKVSGSSDNLFDRSYEVKLRLLKERRVLPEVAVGIRDFLGTGVWGSEYLVGTKSLGAFDFTLGAGWGRLAERSSFTNPLANLSDAFEVRDTDFGLGGEPSFQSYFRGPDVGVFGGITYDLKKWNTRLILEYNTDSYARERRLGTISEASPISYGLEWEPTPGLVLGLSHQQGNQIAFSISASAQTKTVMPRKNSNLVVTMQAMGDEDDENGYLPWYNRLRNEASSQGLALRSASLSVDERTLTLEINNTQYNLMADAVNRFLLLAEINAPATVSTINLLLNENGYVTATVQYQRQFGLNDTSQWLSGADRIQVLPPQEQVNPSQITRFRVPSLQLGADIVTRVGLFDPDKPLRYQVALKTTASLNLGKNYILAASYLWDIDNDFDTIRRSSNSVLPKVRSDIDRYLKEGDTGLDSLFLQKRGKLSDDLYYRAYSGYLEEMYFGAGSEILYRPFESRLSFGANMNWVKQRDFDKQFGLRDYTTVTGHLSAYWATPFYNYDVALHVGRYLAKDWGSTIDIRRTFNNGWMIGAWATFTDVSAEDFGEGSFDKGIFLRIPFNNLLSSNTRSSYATTIRSIQRDGGQRLENFGTTLWYDLRPTRYDALQSNRLRMVPGL